MDVRRIARDLVREITDAVHQRFNPRSGVLVPSRLSGRHPVPGAKLGEQVMDAADALLESVCDDWPRQIEPEVYLDLVEDGAHWYVSWVVDTAAAEDAG